MQRQMQILTGLLILCCGAGCNFKMFNAGENKAALRECETERTRLNKELSEARNLRDQYRVEYEKLKTADKPETPGQPMVSSPADAQIRAARQSAEIAQSEARLAKENLAGANARVSALEKQIVDLQQQSDKLRNSLATESQQRAVAQEKALAVDQALAQAASAKAALADLQKQLDAAILEKQKLTQQLEALKK